MSNAPTLELITPKMAAQYLEKNDTNRPINEKNLNQLTMDMTRDNWHITGETIKFAKNGALLDGQHRLMSIVRTGKAQHMYVIRGLDNEAFKYIDTGKKRSAADVLGIEGIKHPLRIASMSRFVMLFTEGRILKAISSASVITNADVSSFVHKNQKQLADSMEYGWNKENKAVPPVLLSSFHFIAYRLNKEDAETFCWKLATGENLTRESPIFMLRQKLLADIRSTKKMGRVERVALICKAWNLFRGKQKVTLLKWDGLREPFPKLV